MKVNIHLKKQAKFLAGGTILWILMISIAIGWKTPWKTLT